MSEWELFFYATSRGRRPVQEYLDGLSATEAASVVADLDLLAEFDLRLGLPRARPVRGNLWELRVVGRVQRRVLYVALSGQRFLLLHAFAKKTPKTPAEEIGLAERRLAEHQSREEG